MMFSEDDEALLQVWRGRLFAIAYAELGGRYDDAQDAVARALNRMFRHRAQLRDPARFGAWASQIVRREARRVVARPTAALSETHPAPAVDFHLALDIAAALRALPAALALTCALHYRDGLGVRELAERLGVAEGMIKWRLSEGRARLRLALKDYTPMEHRRVALVAPHLDPALHQTLIDLLLATGATTVTPVASFLEATALAQTEHAAIVVGERIGAHSAFELLPILRQSAAARLWLLLDPGRTEAEKTAAATAAYVLGVDLLLNLPAPHDELAGFCRRLLA